MERIRETIRELKLQVDKRRAAAYQADAHATLLRKVFRDFTAHKENEAKLIAAKAALEKADQVFASWNGHSEFRTSKFRDLDPARRIP